MDKLPANNDYNIVAISPQLIKTLNNIKKQSADKEIKEDKSEQLANSMDGLSSIMRAKVGQFKKPPLEEIARRAVKESILETMAEKDIDINSISDDEIEEMVESVVQDGTADEMILQTKEKVTELLADYLQKAANNAIEKGHIISIDELEKMAKDLEEKN